MQTSIFVCNNVYFGGIFHANESQTCLPIPCSKTLQIIASIFANYSACKHQFSFAKICVFSGIFHAKESHTFLLNACLKTLQIIASICAKICMQTSIFVCNNVYFGGIFHANESQTWLPIPCSKTLQIIASIFANYSACKHQFSFAIMCIFQVYFMQKKAIRSY